MSAVSFRNRGIIELAAIRTFGVSAKETESPIGFFGTGLKYAIAICLRLGCEVTLWRGRQEVTFSTSDVAIRNGQFRIVTMTRPELTPEGDDTGDLVTEQLGFTTDLGKTWEPWQAFRELYCNTLDEGGQCLDGEAEPLEDHTLVTIKGAAFYTAYLERSQIVIDAAPRWSTHDLQIHDRSSRYGYFRGIRVSKLQHASVLTYNSLSGMELTEDRTLKTPYQLDIVVSRTILRSEDTDLITRFLQAPSESYESKIDLDNWTDPSPTFLRTMENLNFRAITNMTALRVYKKHARKVLEPDPVALNKIEQIQLRRAMEFCEWGGYSIEEYPVVVTKDLEEHVWGQAYEGRIYLNRSAFQAGTKIVAGTLIEEYIHLKHSLRDESRDLQNHLLNALVSSIELARGEPL